MLYGIPIISLMWSSTFVSEIANTICWMLGTFDSDLLKLVGYATASHNELNDATCHWETEDESCIERGEKKLSKNYRDTIEYCKGNDCIKWSSYERSPTSYSKKWIANDKDYAETGLFASIAFNANVHLIRTKGPSLSLTVAFQICYCCTMNAKCQTDHRRLSWVFWSICHFHSFNFDDTGNNNGWINSHI